MKTLLLVDGSSYLYRAFHALPDLRNKDHEPTGALYGMINMLKRLRKDYPADYSACVFDAKGKTFRDAIYPQYKANRPSMPDDLVKQIAPIHQAVQALGWQLLMVEGVEADDVIGTYARQAAQHGLQVVISTGDKDMAQLVNADIKLVNTMSNEVLDEAGVEAKFGIPPALIVDYLTLIGDTVDNVPGVEKVGPKTAVKWLLEHGSLDSIIASAAQIKGVVGENLRQALDWLPTGRELITIKSDLALPTPIENLLHAPENNTALQELYTHYGFKTWLRELQSGTDTNPTAKSATAKNISGDLFDNTFAEPPATSTNNTASTYQANQSRQYHTITTPAQLESWLAQLRQAPLVCVDTETTSLDPMQASIVGISFAITAGEAMYIPLRHDYAGAPPQLNVDSTLAALKPLLQDPSIKKVGQNLKYDLHVFANHGIYLQGVADDTLLESYVLESHRTHNMDDLALRHLGLTTITYEQIAGKGAKQVPFAQIAVETASEYAAEDADITLQLHQALYPRIAADSGLLHIYRNIEMPAMQVLFEMERNGVLIDSAMLHRQSHALGQQLLSLEQKAHELAGQPFNLGSPKQLQEILFGKLGIKPIKKTPSGAPSTDEDVLTELALDYPLPKVILEHRSLSKLKSTYTDKLPKEINPATGRVHTNYSQATANTGRLASTNPNLQNIPVRTAEGRRIREAFIAPAGSKIVSADYSQIELRIMAHLSQDAGLLNAFAQGEDIHRATAAEVFGVALNQVDNEQRRYAKVINFGLIYGMSAFGLAQNLGIDRTAAQNYIERYFARYPGVRTYMNETRAEAHSKGYVETLFGRRLWISEINSPNGQRRAGAERAAINAPMQGTAADLIKMAMIAVSHWLKTEHMHSKLIMQVHDELVLEVPQHELEKVKLALPQLMQQVATLDVPLLVEVGVGDNWESAH